MSFVQGTSADAGNVTSTSLTYGSPVTSGHTLWFAARYGGTTDNYSSVSDSVNAGNWTKNNVQNETVGGGDWSYWGFKAQTAAGTPQVTISFSSSATVRFCIAEDSASAAAPVDISATADDNSISTSVAGASATTSNANDSLIAIFGLQNGNGITADSGGWTNRFAVPNAATAKLYVSTQDVTSTGTYSDTLTANTPGETASAIFVALKQPAGASVFPYPPFQLKAVA